ncbi:hypothetical protein Tco_0478611 [Tanacetum coccineum]
MFPSEFKTSLGIPSNLDDRNAAPFKLFDFAVHNFHWFLDEMQFIIHLDLFLWYDEGFIRQVLLEIRDVKCAVYTA